MKVNNVIYAIVNCVNKKMYIGSTYNNKKRWREHKSLLSRNMHGNKYLQRSWNKYGENNFEFRIIEFVKDELQLLYREDYWIQRCNSCNIHYGYNLVETPSRPTHKCSEETRLKLRLSHLGHKHSEEHKRKIGLAQIGNKHGLGKKRKPFSKETRLKLRLTQLGRKHTEEAKSKMRLKHLGKVLSNEHKLKISNALKQRKINRQAKEAVVVPPTVDSKLTDLIGKEL